MKVLLVAPNETKLREMYWIQGQSLAQIGEKYGVEYGVVYWWLERAGIPRRTITDARRLREERKPRVCRECGEAIENYLPKYGRICRACLRLQWKKYRPSIEVSRERATSWRRRRRVQTSENLTLIGDKRTYPGKCEICGKPPKKALHYHHWDNSNLLRGLWLCPTCHHAITVIESYGQSVYGKYIILKELIDKEVETNPSIAMRT